MTVTPLTVVERAEMAAHGWSCARCPADPVVRVPDTAGGFRFCLEHGVVVGRRLAALNERSAA